MLGIFYLRKKLKLLKKDIESDVNRIEWTFLQIRSDWSRIRIIFIGFKSDYFLLDLNRIILSRIGSDLHRIRTILPSLGLGFTVVAVVSYYPIREIIRV